MAGSDGHHPARPALLPPKDAVLTLVRAGHSYRAIAQRYGITAGLAYLIATGVPCDSSDGLSPEDLAREGLLHDSSQHLAHPPVAEKSEGAVVRHFLRTRANADAQMQGAARR